MIRGLYTSGWSMQANSRKMDVISNNLANVNTNAYKKDTVVFESFPDLLARRINDTASVLNPSGKVGNMELGSDVGEIYTYYTQGQLTKTGNNLDMGIDGSDKAFFTIGVPDDNGNLKEYFTRDGSFSLDSSNRLVTREGYSVMGKKGPITINSSNFIVDSDGTVIEDGQPVDRLLIREFPNTAILRKFGSNLVESTDDTQAQASSGSVVQGVVEQSNVNVIKEMVDMITVMRAYEANQKILQAQDGTLEKVVNEVGIVR